MSHNISIKSKQNGLDKKVLKEYLLKLKSIEKQSISIDECKKYIFSKKHKGFMNVRVFHDFVQKPFFRARSLNSNENDEEISTFSYPPIQYNKIGRANLKSKQVFYCSNDPATSIFEYLNTGQSGDEIYLSEWGLNKDISIPTYNIMEMPFAENDFFIKFPNSDKELFEIITEIFSVITMLYKKTSEYHFSAPFSHFLLYCSDKCNMIRYPSIATLEFNWCLAIQKEFFDANFHFKKVYKMKVGQHYNIGSFENINYPVVNISVPTIGQLVNNKIQYSEIQEEDFKFWERYKINSMGENQIKSNGITRTIRQTHF